MCAVGFPMISVGAAAVKLTVFSVFLTVAGHRFSALGEGLFADVALVILVVIRALGEGLFSDVTLVIKKELKY